MSDGRRNNRPAFNPNPAKTKSEKSKTFQFRLHPDDKLEDKFMTWISENRVNGWSVRGLMRELFQQYTDDPKPMEIDKKDIDEMKESIHWIAEQLASGVLVTSQPKGSRKPTSKPMPNNIQVVVEHFKERSSARRSLNVDED